MKKIIFILISLFFLTIISIAVFLSTKGYETKKFNTFISEKIKSTEEKLDVKLKTVKIKLDLKKFDLFLSTNEPVTKYENINLPISRLSIYFDIFSLLKKDPYIKRVNVVFGELKVSEIKKLVVRIKPSNFKSFLLNNIAEGSMKVSIDLDFFQNLELSKYKVVGSLKNTKINFFNKIEIENTNFNFISDPDLTLINSISFDFNGIPITNGLVSISQKDGFIIEGSLNANVDSDSDTDKLSELEKVFPSLSFSDKEFTIKGNFLNKFKIDLDTTLKLKDYTYNLSGGLKESNFGFDKKIENFFLRKPIKEIFIDKSKVKIDLAKGKKDQIFIEGFYKLNEKNEYQKFKIESISKKSNFDLKLNLDFNEYIFIELLNYRKKEDKVANIITELNLKDEKIEIVKFNYIDGKNIISLNGVNINKKNQIEDFKSIKVKTFNNDIENNNFEVLFGKKIVVNGKSYDATNLIKNINEKEKSNLFNKINKEINISFENIFTKLSIPLNNFNLIGKIKKGKFEKISSKSEFSDNRYLDISLKKNLDDNKKTLEIYSGLAKPLLADFTFFKGIEGGELLFNSVFNDKTSSSNLQIKDFKVLNAPAFAKLLALADLSGPAVLLSGEGLRFDSLEIKFTDDEKVRTIKEIYAVGPSITILMEGYVENKSGLTSLRGTMVPAKEINKLISKIPVIGDILIGKEIGEGVFGVSFKIKGLPGKIKTTVNPIKTLTPRFITRALEKRKKENKN